MVPELIDIEKSSRHQKIIGDLGEHLVCNWLSRSGFEVTIVDHTGIDVIAYDPKTKKRLGITVKSRTRNQGKEKESVNLFNNRKGDRQKTKGACEAFKCETFIAVYIEMTEYADLYLTSLSHYDAKYRSGSVVDDWKMSSKWLTAYDEDEEVKHLHIAFRAKSWFRR